MKMEERDRIIRDEGIQKGRHEGIRILIETLKDMGQDKETICNKLMERYDLNADDVQIIWTSFLPKLPRIDEWQNRPLSPVYQSFLLMLYISQYVMTV